MHFLDLWLRATRKPEPLVQKPTPEQVKIMKDLMRHPGWKLYVEAVDRYTSMLAEQLLVQPDPNRLIDIRSEIRGMRNAPLLVAQVIQIEELNDEQQRTITAAFTDPGERRYDSGPYAPS